MPVDPADHEWFPGDGVELLERGKVRSIPSGLVEPLQEAWHQAAAEMTGAGANPLAIPA